MPRRALPTLALLLPALALAQSPPQASIADLLTALKTAPSEEVAGQIEDRIEFLWAHQANPTAALLMARGIRNQRAGDPQEAIDDFSAVLDLQPNLPEALRQRAIARDHAGDYAGAVADIQATLRIEPRQFLAWRDLSRFAEGREDWKGAYAAWQKLMEIDPKTPGGQDRLQDLKRRALGDET